MQERYKGAAINGIISCSSVLEVLTALNYASLDVPGIHRKDVLAVYHLETLITSNASAYFAFI
jgi:hypothetical protein